MLWKPQSLPEYLMNNMNKDTLTFVDDILNKWPGYCIWLNQGGKCYFNSYSVPKYLIKEIDKDNSRLIVYPITNEITSESRDYDGTWNTFKYTVEKKTKSLKLSILHINQIKIGNQYVNIANIRATDLKQEEQDKRLTRINVWD